MSSLPPDTFGRTPGCKVQIHHLVGGWSVGKDVSLFVPLMPEVAHDERMVEGDTARREHRLIGEEGACQLTVSMAFLQNNDRCSCIPATPLGSNEKVPVRTIFQTQFRVG